MGEMKESVDHVIHMMEELSKHQPETMQHFMTFMGSTLKKGVSYKDKRTCCCWNCKYRPMQI